METQIDFRSMMENKKTIGDLKEFEVSVRKLNDPKKINKKDYAENLVKNIQ